MGSDMAMEVRDYRPRPSYAEWDGDDLVIYRDYAISGYKEFWRGTRPNLGDKTVVSLLETMVKEIPAKPIPLEEKLERILMRYYAGQKSTIEAINEIKDLFGAGTTD